MPRRILPQTSEFPYHVTARSNNKEWFYLPIERLWKIFEEQIHKVTLLYHAHIISFVLMNNHYHLLINTPESNLGAIMNYLQREVSRTIGTDSGRINHVFGGGYRATQIKKENYFEHAYKYVYRNPVAAGICADVETYPYSTISYLTGRRRMEFALSEFELLNQTNVPVDLEIRIHWLNNPYSEAQTEIIRRALRRTEFRYPKGSPIFRNAARELLGAP